MRDQDEADSRAAAGIHFRPVSAMNRRACHRFQVRREPGAMRHEASVRGGHVVQLLGQPARPLTRSRTTVADPLKMERAMGIEPTTSSLGSLRSTSELRPQSLFLSKA